MPETKAIPAKKAKSVKPKIIRPRPKAKVSSVPVEKKQKEKDAAIKPRIVSIEYLAAIGKRKRAIVKLKLYPNGKGEMMINNRTLEVYFPLETLQRIILSPLKLAGLKENVNVVAKACGGGIKAQADALRLAISRALLKLKPELRPTLRGLGFLTRDSRKKERKKYGLKKARKAPQWSKR